MEQTKLKAFNPGILPTHGQYRQFDAPIPWKNYPTGDSQPAKLPVHHKSNQPFKTS